jgi:hypothetical protein
MAGKKKREEACFEAGIKLGALFHQFIGIPVSMENVELVERVMESCMKLQPYVSFSKVRIDRKKLKKSMSEFGYTSLEGEMLYAEVVVRVDEEEVRAILRWDEEKKYPLMSLI